MVYEPYGPIYHNLGFNVIRTRGLRDPVRWSELWSHTLGARSICWVHIFPCSEMMWNIYEMCGFTTQLVEHRTGVAEFTAGFDSRWSPDIFQASSFQLLGKFTAMITLHFHLQPQCKYEFHMKYISHTIISKYGKRTRQLNFKTFPQETMAASENRFGFASELNEKEVVEQLENATPGSIKKATEHKESLKVWHENISR